MKFIYNEIKNQNDKATKIVPVINEIINSKPWAQTPKTIHHY